MYRAAVHLYGEILRRLSEDTAKRVETLSSPEQPEDCVGAAYRILFSRPPNTDEQDLGSEFIGTHGLKRYIHALMCTNEFIHLN